MTMTDINALSTEEKEIKVVELKRELLNLRFQLATGNLEDTSEFKKIKKDIARIKTNLSTTK